MSKEAMKQPEALRLADVLDDEFTQGRISNHTGRKAAVELRRLALKQWVGLTDEELYDCEEEVGVPQYEISSADLYAFARAIEQALKDKNT